MYYFLFNDLFNYLFLYSDLHENLGTSESYIFVKNRPLPFEFRNSWLLLFSDFQNHSGIYFVCMFFYTNFRFISIGDKGALSHFYFYFISFRYEGADRGYLSTFSIPLILSPSPSSFLPLLFSFLPFPSLLSPSLLSFPFSPLSPLSLPSLLSLSPFILSPLTPCLPLPCPPPRIYWGIIQS